MLVQAKQELFWSESAEHELSTTALNLLFRGEMPYIRIPNFASVAECEALVASAVKQGFGPYRAVEPEINRIGNTVFEYNSISKHEYFEKNIQLGATQAQIFQQSFNPLQRFIEQLQQQTSRKVGVARNLNGDLYYAGLVRRIENGTLLHVDYARAEQPDWEVASIGEQLAWNLYLRVSHPDSGHTHIFNRQWRPSDAASKEGIYGYHQAVVDGADEAIFAPTVGEVVIFNTRNFHYVEPTVGERVSFTSALGRASSGELVLWS